MHLTEEEFLQDVSYVYEQSPIFNGLSFDKRLFGVDLINKLESEYELFEKELEKLSQDSDYYIRDSLIELFFTIMSYVTFYQIDLHYPKVFDGLLISCDLELLKQISQGLAMFSNILRQQYSYFVNDFSYMEVCQLENVSFISALLDRHFLIKLELFKESEQGLTI